MSKPSLRNFLIDHLLPRVQAPAQYIGGEWNSVFKDRAGVRGTLCLAYPDAYAIGMSDNGLQMLYAIMNGRGDWACERAFTPQTDLEMLLRQHDVPLVSLESFAPLSAFDIVAFALPHELCATNVLTMLDLGGIPLAAEDRASTDPLVIGHGACAASPEPMARFIDAFILGDSEEAMPAVCDLWLEMKQSGLSRGEALARLAPPLPFLYVPRCHNLRMSFEPATVADLDAAPLPLRPIVPHVECARERIEIEIARDCPFRFRRVETIVRAAVDAYHSTGYDEIALLGPVSCEYPNIEELLEKLRTIFRPLGVRITMPNLPVNERWPMLNKLLDLDRHEGATFAPLAACDDLRERSGVRMKNDELFACCRQAMENGCSRFNLHFACGLPGERQADLDAIIDMAEQLSRLGREAMGRYAGVIVNVSNFIPKPHAPFHRDAMQSRDYFEASHEHLRKRKRMRDVALRCCDIESSLIEAALSRGDRRFGPVIEAVWRGGARMETTADRLRPWLWWQAITEAGINLDELLHCPHDGTA